MKILTLISLFALLTACNSGSSSDSTAALVSVASCQDIGVDGTWNGTIAGNADVMVIASDCTTTSSYCQSQSNIKITSVSSSCGSGIASCGSLTFIVNYNNNSGFCATPGVTYNCVYGLNASGTTLSYDCGGGAEVYTR